MGNVVVAAVRRRAGRASPSPPTARYGKGSGHKAQLNLGDCAAYALATSLDLPLLFKGNDFTHTDVRSALAPS